ncbi:hypothetical protein pdam_00003098 [Pocillopora damicornis]|uniref:Uncharacterized protein n=1 Tax=Pocillopora damicornis TaxID=46731 RepID=A0A3M6T9W5_POCDA|nr:hypothetical protein pdam_00003098 [Pocillopora damicornis]
MADTEKRRLCDMDAEQFMMHGFDSDLSDDEESLPEENTLSPLPGKVPQNGARLPTNTQISTENLKSEAKRDGSDDSEEDDGLDDRNEENKDANEGQKVSLDMIKGWRAGLEKNSLHALKKSLQAFRSAVHGALGTVDDSKTQTPLKFKVEGDTVFNAIVQLCLKHAYSVLFHHVGGTHNRHGKRVLPSSHTKWSQVKTPLKHYLSDVLQLLRTLTEPSMLCVILRHAQQLTPYYACFPKVAKAFIKRLVRMWSGGEEHVRVLAFLGIRNVSTMMPAALLEFTVKQLYMNFVKNAKFMSPKTKPVIAFMQNSLVEIFSLDEHLSYQYGFVYIRQLAIHLRNAILQKKKDSYQSVYNWQYIHCLHLWCRVISEVKGSGVLQPLIYPLVQTIIGAIKLIPAARFYPLRFHCVRSLNLLSQATDTYIPVAPFLLEDAVMDHIFELLLEFFSIHAHSIAFPEVALPAVLRERWTAQYRQQPNSIVKFYKTWKTMKPSIQQEDMEIETGNGENEETSDGEETKAASKRKRKHQSSENKKELEKDKTKRRKAVNKTTSENTSHTMNITMDADVEDIVEDFQFSSDED